MMRERKLAGFDYWKVECFRESFESQGEAFVSQVSNAEERGAWFNVHLQQNGRCASLCGLVKIGHKYLTTDGYRPCRRQQAGALHILHMLSAFGQSLWLG